jgi:RIO-like serine/threonine protein kinase
MFENLKLSDIQVKQSGILRTHSNTRPILWLIEENGKRAVVKDFSLNGVLFRNIIGRFLVWREKKAYANLKGIKGIPTFYREIDGLAIVIEEIQGSNLQRIHDSTGIPAKFYSDLYSLLNIIHHSGIAHCDLKRAPNIILGSDGNPYIVDWSAAIFKSEFRFFPLSLIFSRFVRDDLQAVIKLKLKFNPDMATPEEKISYMDKSRAERIIRFLRDKARDLLKKIS